MASLLILAIVVSLQIHLSSYKVILLKCESDISRNALMKKKKKKKRNALMEYLFLRMANKASVIWLPFFQRFSCSFFCFHPYYYCFQFPKHTLFSQTTFCMIISSWSAPSLSPPSECTLQFKCFSSRKLSLVFFPSSPLFFQIPCTFHPALL